MSHPCVFGNVIDKTKKKKTSYTSTHIKSLKYVQAKI